MHRLDRDSEPMEGVVLPSQKEILQPLPPDPCLHYEKIPNPPPFYVRTQEVGFIVTQIQNSCVNRDGENGFFRVTPWMAMGIPCSGGQGKVHLKKPYYAPQLITFSLSTDCPMDPGALTGVQELGQQWLGLHQESVLQTYNPFSLLYWEVVGFEDAGLGEDIELSTSSAREQLWPKFKNGEALPVILIGRENAWMATPILYEVRADILREPSPSGGFRFRLKLEDVTPLGESGVEAVKKRCLAIRPRLRCGDIF